MLKYDNIISCINIMVIIEEFVISKEINNRCIALSQKKIVLANLSIVVDFSKYKKNTMLFI